MSATEMHSAPAIVCLGSGKEVERLKMAMPKQRRHAASPMRGVAARVGEGGDCEVGTRREAVAGAARTFAGAVRLAKDDDRARHHGQQLG
jgi:hypothetical protein